MGSFSAQTTRGARDTSIAFFIAAAARSMSVIEHVVAGTRSAYNVALSLSIVVDLAANGQLL
jgi:hypothetical protein